MIYQVLLCLLLVRNYLLVAFPLINLYATIQHMDLLSLGLVRDSGLNASLRMLQVRHAFRMCVTLETLLMYQTFIFYDYLCACSNDIDIEVPNFSLYSTFDSSIFST